MLKKSNNSTFLLNDTPYAKKKFTLEKQPWENYFSPPVREIGAGVSNLYDDLKGKDGKR